MSKKLHEEHEEVIHYTSASGLHGIVTSKTIWASHTSFLNDTEEVVGFFDRVLPILLKPEFERYWKEVEDLPSLVQARFLSEEDAFNHYLKKIVDGFKEAELRAQDHYVASFCTTDGPWISEHGLLSQWRGYGPDGGYAVVFDSEGLESLLAKEAKIYYEEGLMWADAQYHMSELSDVRDEQVLEHVQKVKDSAYRYFQTNEIKEAYPAFESITLLSTICKHRGFDEEKEVRIVASEPSVELGPDPLKESEKPYRKIHSYFRDGSVVSCIHLFEDQKLKTLPIRRVIVGPHPEKLHRKRAVEILLHNHGIEATVSASDTPFRGK